MSYSAFLKPRQETISEEGIEGIVAGRLRLNDRDWDQFFNKLLEKFSALKKVERN